MTYKNIKNNYLELLKKYLVKKLIDYNMKKLIFKANLHNMQIYKLHYKY